MRDPKRISIIIGLLQEAWLKVPDWRLCQLISNLHGPGPHDVFFTEDDVLEEALKEFIQTA
jgi:uncharacterized protein YihD (DUF1040 family)